MEREGERKLITLVDSSAVLAMTGKAWEQKQEAPGHIESIVPKKRPGSGAGQ